METFRWTNPKAIDLTAPFLYLITVRSPTREYRYVGKASSASRLDAYWKNVKKVLSGKPKRPAVKRDGSPQSAGNTRFRYVHLVLACAVQRGWEVQHYPIENASKSELNVREAALISQLECDMNSGPSWPVEEFEARSGLLR